MGLEESRRIERERPFVCVQFGEAGQPVVPDVEPGEEGEEEEEV